MYRLVLYCLIALVGVAAIFGFLGFVPYGGFNIISSVFILLLLGLSANYIFAKVFNATTNVESIYISVLILALIIQPVKTFGDLSFYFWAIIWTVASKFIFTIGKKHLFNPVAVAVFMTSIFIGASAIWWVGSLNMLPLVAIVSLLIIRKTQREAMFFTFLITTSLVTVVASFFSSAEILSSLTKIFLHSPAVFFAGVMLTEPLTTPPTKNLRLTYAAIVGFLFAPQVHIGSFYTTPEMALLFGNVFSYIVSPKEKLILTLKEKIVIAPTIVDFIFRKDKDFAFEPGQYLEWTLGHEHPDSRGNRRYFTIASAPTETDVRIGVKFYEKPSSFKTNLYRMKYGDKIMAGGRAGDFTLPKNLGEKLVFIAGGIGITPFRSIIKNMLDTGKKRDIVVLYSIKNPQDLVYKDVLEEATKKFGIKTAYYASDAASVGASWIGKVGRIDGNALISEVPDFKDRIFYLSGPHAMVDAFEDTLLKIGIAKRKIKTDFFPGFA